MITDKTLVILALVIVALGSMYTLGMSSENIITAIVAGLCGIAVGSKINGEPVRTANQRATDVQPETKKEGE